MSKSNKFEQIGRIIAAVVALPEKHLGITLDIVNKLRDPGWKVHLTQVLREGLGPCYQTDNLFDPSEYFTTRDGLWVSSEFTSRILLVHNKLVQKRGLEGVTYINFPKNVCDSDIIKNHLDGEEEIRKHAFTPDQIADLIDIQKDGGEGDLLNNGNANIFYVIGKDEVLLTVCVDWHGGLRSWRVLTWDLDGDSRWSVSHRIFCNKN